MSGENNSQRVSSEKAFAKACKVIPGGVNSPVRAFGSVGGKPIFMSRASGAYLFDEDGQKYIDYIGSWGPMILGHGHPEVVESVKKAIDNGFTFGTATSSETHLVEKVKEFIPSIEMARLVSSGTEACMAALRLARGFTGRDKILKFEGCYHGHADMLLVKAGSGVATLGIPGSPGVPKGATQDTLVAPFNNLEAAREAVKLHGSDLAAIIVEPIVGNAGFLRPDKSFLSGLRQLCNESGALLIFDEVMTGFRVAPGGAQSLFDIKPDLTTLGKVIGGGMPIGAYGGRADVMASIAPMGPVYQAGTLSGNPVAVACGLKTLEVLQQSDFSGLAKLTSDLVAGLQSIAKDHGIPLAVDSEGGMFGLAFNETLPKNFAEIASSNMDIFNRFFHTMLNQGIYLAPSGYEAGFVSFSHLEKDIEATLEAAKVAFAAL